MREDKMVHSSVGADIERSLTVAIRRAAQTDSQDELFALVAQVGELAGTATRSRDSNLMAAVGRLLKELRAAASDGPKINRPVLEYKDSAVALSWTSFAPLQSKRTRKEREFGGYGSTFGGEPDSYGDIIERGAYKKTLARHRAAGTLPKLFWSHDPSQVPGKWISMEEDSVGLVSEGILAKTTLGNDLNELIDMEAVDALSIGFSIPEGGARYSKGTRIISEIDLWEVSLVSLPANRNARLTPSKGADKVAEAFAALKRVVAEADQRDTNVINFPRASSDDETAVLASLQRMSQSISSYTR